MTGTPQAGDGSFGRYRLERVLGRGGMGVVHAAHDTVLGREVALKIVAPHLADDPEFRARFQHEAEVLARLDSDRIVRIFDHGEHEGSLFIVTQLVDGGDLQKLVAERGALAPALAVDVVAQVLEGLRDAHAVGVVHRDIKPANVLLRQRQGEVQAFLCDFGIATTAGAGFTMTGGVAGSLPYMAPERHLGQDAVPVSDVYAVGCLLWHALTGAAPYAGTDFEIATAHVEGPVPRLPGRDDFSRRINAVLEKALAKDPRKRFSSAKAMLADLLPLAEQAPGVIALPGATAIRRPVVVRRRRWVAPVAAAVSVVAVVAGVVAVAALSDQERGSRADAVPPPATLTETVSAGGRFLGNQVTLLPRAERSTQADGDVVVAPGPTAGEPPTADAPRTPGAVRPSTAPTRRAPAPAPTTAPPLPRYACWDGDTAMELADCGFPTGVAGARWMNSAMAGRSCWKANPGDARLVESWGCSVSGGSFYVARVTGGSDGAAWLRERMPRDRISNDWHTGTVRAGTAYRGDAVISGVTHRRWGAVYAIGGSSWVLYVDTTSGTARDGAIKLLNDHKRHVNWVRGEPCSQSSAC